MLDKLIQFINKNKEYILIAILLICILDRFILSRLEGYKQLGGCVPYIMLGREVGYMDCKPYGYVVPTNEPKSKPIALSKCKIGVPYNSMKYKIIIDEIERYSEILKYQTMGHVVGARLRFDNGKEYKIISNDPNTIM